MLTSSYLHMMNTALFSIRCFLLIGLLLLTIDWARAQSQPNDEPIQLSGVIVNKADEPVPFVTVSNLSTQRGVVSNDEGFFYITFPAQDTLQLSAVNYEPYELYFGDTARASNYDLKIRLSERTYQLEEVTVFAFRDEAAFKKAILALDDLPEEPEKIVIPGTFQGTPTKPSASLASPISFIADRFNKRAKYERQLKQAQRDAAYQKTLAKKYNRTMVSEITGLADERLDEFMLFCRFKDKFIERSNEYEIILAINRCYVDFQQGN